MSNRKIIDLTAENVVSNVAWGDAEVMQMAIAASYATYSQEINRRAVLNVDEESLSPSHSGQESYVSVARRAMNAEKAPVLNYISPDLFVATKKAANKKQETIAPVVRGEEVKTASKRKENDEEVVLVSPSKPIMQKELEVLDTLPAKKDKKETNSAKVAKEDTKKAQKKSDKEKKGKDKQSKAKKAAASQKASKDAVPSEKDKKENTANSKKTTENEPVPLDILRTEYYGTIERTCFKVINKKKDELYRQLETRIAELDGMKMKHCKAWAYDMQDEITDLVVYGPIYRMQKTVNNASKVAKSLARMGIKVIHPSYRVNLTDTSKYPANKNSYLAFICPNYAERKTLREINFEDMQAKEASDIIGDALFAAASFATEGVDMTEDDYIFVVRGKVYANCACVFPLIPVNEMYVAVKNDWQKILGCDEFIRVILKMLESEAKTLIVTHMTRIVKELMEKRKDLSSNGKGRFDAVLVALYKLVKNSAASEDLDTIFTESIEDIKRSVNSKANSKLNKKKKNKKGKKKESNKKSKKEGKSAEEKKKKGTSEDQESDEDENQNSDEEDIENSDEEEEGDEADDEEEDGSVENEEEGIVEPKKRAFTVLEESDVPAAKIQKTSGDELQTKKISTDETGEKEKGKAKNPHGKKDYRDSLTEEEKNMFAASSEEEDAASTTADFRELLKRNFDPDGVEIFRAMHSDYSVTPAEDTIFPKKVKRLTLAGIADRSNEEEQ